MDKDPVGDGIFVGIDSGGTRTNVDVMVIESDAEPRCKSYEVSDCLSGALSPQAVPDVLNRIVAPLEIALDEMEAPNLPIYLWVSAAGFSPWTREYFSTALYNLSATITPYPAAAAGAANDAVTLLLGSHADGIIIAGTGSNVVIRQSDDSLYQSGGHEWVASDYGSGFWIGLDAIRAAYRDYEAGVHSVLLQRLRQVYGIREADDRAFIAKLRDLAIGDEHFKKQIARFAASVCAAAERGDLAAQNIVKSQAEDLADVTALALRRCFRMEELLNGITLLQCGSLLANSFYRRSFEAQIEMRLLSDVENDIPIVTERCLTGTSQAIQMARQLLSNRATLMNLSSSFRPAIVTF